MRPDPGSFQRGLLAVLLLSLASCRPGAVAGAEKSDSPPARVVGEDWPRWRGPRGDGTWNGPPLPQRWPEEGLKTLWKAPVGGGYAGVSVSGDRVLLADRKKEPAEVERLLCFHAATGERLWSHEDAVEYGKLDYGSGPRAAPTVVGGRVYTAGAVGQVNCLELATGKLVWSKHLVHDLKGRLQEWGWSGSPFVFGDLVVLQPGADEEGSIVALDRATGNVAWSALSDQAGYATPILIEVEGKPQLICWTPSHIRALEPRTGKLLWSVPYKVTYGVSIATPVFHRGTVLVSGYWEGSKAIRPGADARAAELLWEENRNLRGLMSQPLCRDDCAYLLDKQYGLTCFELSTGKKLWDDGNRLTPRGRNPQASIVALAGSDRIIALNADGELVLARIAPDGYDEQSRTKIIGETWAHPGFAGRRVYARSDTELVCVELPLAR